MINGTFPRLYNEGNPLRSRVVSTTSFGDRLTGEREGGAVTVLFVVGEQNVIRSSTSLIRYEVKHV